MKRKKIMYLILPCYNEEEILEDSIQKLTSKIEELISKGKISKDSKMVFIDDGSIDKTWKILKNNSKENKYIKALKFSSNRGHQIAVLAGLHYCNNKCDFCISLDSDLQQDINAIDEFINKYNEGNDIVYGVRNSRNTDSFFKKETSQLFYKIMLAFDCNIIVNHADYRLVSNKVLNELIRYNESNVFLRGLFPSMGYKNDIVYFNVFDRTAGKSKYTLRKMLNLAKDGITSFSVKPLQLVLNLGLFMNIISILLLFQYLVIKNKIMLYFGISMFPSSLVIISLGIVAIYIGQIYSETKDRPKYLIEEEIND